MTTSYPTLAGFLQEFHLDWRLDHPGGWRDVTAEARGTLAPEVRAQLVDDLEELADSDLPDADVLRWVLVRGDGLPRTGDLEPGAGIRGSLRLLADELRVGPS
jgi:hypothetical protein